MTRYYFAEYFLVAGLSVAALSASTDSAAAAACNPLTYTSPNGTFSQTVDGDALVDIYTGGPPGTGTLYDGSPSCDALTDQGVTDTAALVNAQSMQGEDDWALLGRYDITTGSPSWVSAGAPTPGGVSDYDTEIYFADPASDGVDGTFVVTEQARALFDEIVVLMQRAGSDYWVSYLITDIPNLPDYVYYDSPFLRMTDSGKTVYQAIDSIAFYGRLDTSNVEDVPVPAAAPLLLGALGALAAARRRRSSRRV